MPSPPCERSSRRSTCTNMSKTFVSISGAIPIPVSSTPMTTSSPSRRASRQIRPPGSVYLAALSSRLARTCSSRVGSASSRSSSSGTPTLSSWPRSSISGAGRGDGLAHDRGQVHDLLAKLDLAQADPGDVHQVVDQPGQVLDLPVHHRPQGLDGRVCPPRCA